MRSIPVAAKPARRPTPWRLAPRAAPARPILQRPGAHPGRRAHCDRDGPAASPDRGIGPGLRMRPAAALLLNRRAPDRAERTEHAAVAGFWPQQRVAAGALVEESARIRRHRFLPCKAAMGAGEHRLENHAFHVRPALTCDKNALGAKSIAWPIHRTGRMIRSTGCPSTLLIGK